MKIIINDKSKKDIFVSLFQILKNCTNIVCVNFEKDRFFIQGMDKSHVCLFNIEIVSSWFSDYDIEYETNISFDTSIFHTIISTKQDSHDIVIHMDDNESDNLNIDLISHNLKSDFNKYFKIPLADYEYEIMNIDNIDYDAEFLINSKKICDIFSQMIFFGKDINIKCSEDRMDIITDGVTGEMRVNIPIDDLCEFSIVEDNELNLKYSLTYINKMCLTNKLTSEIGFSISNEAPMRIKYDLGDNSSIIFFIAPKLNDD
jgi:proliferating cell nuclear antigen PCNA